MNNTEQANFSAATINIEPDPELLCFIHVHDHSRIAVVLVKSHFPCKCWKWMSQTHVVMTHFLEFQELISKWETTLVVNPESEFIGDLERAGYILDSHPILGSLDQFITVVRKSFWTQINWIATSQPKRQPSLIGRQHFNYLQIHNYLQTCTKIQ